MTTKSTLLDIVQDILGDMSSDEVNSITDTEDSEQVARIVRSTYRNIITKNTWPHTRQAVTIVARSDSSFPTHMSIKEDLMELISIYYNKALSSETQKRYSEVYYVDPDEFLRRTHKRNNDESNVDVVIDDSGIELLIINDKHPDFYTSIDDDNLIFDSYNSDVDSTLHISKFQAQGYVLPEFQLQDGFIPDLPSDAFPLLIEESTSRAQFKMRQLVDQKSEQESGKQSRKMSRKNWTVNGGITYRNYGRKR